MINSFRKPPPLSLQSQRRSNLFLQLTERHHIMCQLQMRMDLFRHLEVVVVEGAGEDKASVVVTVVVTVEAIVAGSVVVIVGVIVVVQEDSGEESEEVSVESQKHQF